MDLNTILIILGVIALVALVAHGLWANRREKSQYFENANIFTRDSRTQANPAVSEPVTQTAETPVPAFVQPKTAAPSFSAAQSTAGASDMMSSSTAQTVAPTQQNLNFEQVAAAQTDEQVPPEPQSVNHIKITLPDTSPAYEVAEPEPVPQPIPDLGKVTIADIEAHADEEEGITTSSEQLRVQLQEAAQNQPDYAPAINVSPLPAAEDEPEPAAEIRIEPHANETAAEEAPTFIMLYVVAPENRVFHGIPLIQALEDLGFILGKGIYNRHLDILSMTSPVLFSAANITEPGTFEAYRLAEFTTVGIVLFMQLPSAGNDRANLKMMIRAAKTLAEQLGGFVLNDKQEIFTDRNEQEYLARV